MGQPKFYSAICQNFMADCFSIQYTFQSLIHENYSPTDVQKLHSSVCGDARNVLHSLEITNENYVVAWNLLNDSFNNPQLVVWNHMETLHELN